MAGQPDSVERRVSEGGRVRYRPALAVFLVVLGLTLATMRGVLGGGQDEELVFLQTQSLAMEGDLGFSQAELSEAKRRAADYQVAGRMAPDGKWYQVFGPLQSVAGVPFYNAGRAAAGVVPESQQRAVLVRWTMALNPLLTALCAGLLTAWLLALGYDRGVAVAGGLGYGLCSPAWPYAKSFLSEPLSALCFLGAAALAWLARRDGLGPLAALGGCVAAAAVLVRPHNVVVPPLLALLVIRPERPRRSVGMLVLFLPPLLLACGWWLWFNRVRFGAPLDFGYLPEVQHDFALRHLLPGLTGQLFSPGRGLVWYAPAVVLAGWGFPALARRDRTLAWSLLLAVAVQLLFYSLRSVWWANWCWGPRYLVPVLPLLAMLAAPALEDASPARRRLAWVLAGLGLFGALSGLVVYNGLYQEWLFAQPDGVHRLLWNPLESPLLGHWRFALRGYVDLMLWHLIGGDPVFGGAQLVLRLSPALLGLALLRPARPGAGA